MSKVPEVKERQRSMLCKGALPPLEVCKDAADGLTNGGQGSSKLVLGKDWSTNLKRFP